MNISYRCHRNSGSSCYIK